MLATLIKVDDMSREIKFRVMDISGNWHYYTLGDFVCLTAIPAQLRPETWTQYTGLKDENGVEIYEGDILSVMVQEVTRENVHNDPFYKKGKKYHTGKKVKSIWTVEHAIHKCFSGFRVYGINRRFSNGITKSIIFNSRATVVGDIHQHPELLK